MRDRKDWYETMSASREKKLRKAIPAAPVQNNQKKSGSVPKIVAIVLVCVLLVGAIGASLLFSSNWAYNNMTAAKIGQHNLTGADLNYFYRTAYSIISSQYGTDSTVMGYMGEVIMQQALDDAHLTYAAYDAAKAENYELTAEEKETIEEDVKTFKETDDTLKTLNIGINDFNDYMEFFYGTGCNEENYRNYIEVTTIAQRYLKDKTEGYTVSADDISKYYSEHKDELDLLTYRQFTIDVNDTMTLDAAKAAAQKIVDEAKVDESTFTKNAAELVAEDRKESYKDDSATLMEDVKPSLMTEQYVYPAVAQWLKDAQRQKGDATVIVREDNTKVYALYFVSREDHDYTARNLHALLVSADIANGKEEDLKKAKEEAQKYLDEYLAGAKTADAFIAIAEKNSDEKVEKALYENVGKNDISDEMAAWLYDESRVAGDTALLEGTAGYYVTYYVGEGENYREVVIEEVLIAENYSKFCESVREKVDASLVESGLKYVSTQTAATYYQ